MKFTPWIVAMAAMALVGAPAPALALINPKVQPKHLYELHSAVMVCRVAAVDSKALKVAFEVVKVTKGEFAPKQVSMTASSRKLLEGILALEVGQEIVVFAGRHRPASARGDVLYYVGGGKWYKAQMADPDRPGDWQLVGDADEDKVGEEIMFGVFNGSTGALWQMAQDTTSGRLYFPARPFSRFASRKLDTLKTPAEGVALFDVNGDGRLDVVLASPGGNRLYIQDDKGDFNDRTAEWGLSGSVARSVSLADADGDGQPDVLLDGVLYLQRGSQWVRSDLVPEQKAALSAAFVELNGDGYPDVVISVSGGGLRALANSFAAKGAQPKAFEDISATLNLHQKDHGAGGTGYFEAGDWNGDGRTDLLYLSGPGHMLLASDKGFSAILIGDEETDHAYATAAMAPIADPARSAALVLSGDEKRLLESRPTGYADITRFGNEIRDELPGLFAAVAEDLNADGTIDIYAGNRTKGASSFYCVNRGYGSFMMEEKYNAGKIIPPDVYGQPVLGLAAADINGDGANDMVLAGANGTVWLLINQTLADRKDKTELDTLWDERKRIEARIVTVRVEGPTGVVGASLRLVDERGQLVAARQLGGNIGVGCCGPHQVVFTVREPGAHQLEVRYADGAVATLPVDLSADRPRHQTIKVSRQHAGAEAAAVQAQPEKR
jgi:hypothetical protein